jgi:glycerophosphoryl diester phosphodiesterase
VQVIDEARQRTEPLVFAHRGASATLPEHTLSAYLHAIEEGADGLECDVRLTADGHLVCLHDRRLERTSNGRGAVSGYTLAELNRLDFGSWHPGLAGSADDLIFDRPVAGRRAKVLTLARLLTAVRDAGRPIRLLIETKHPTRFRGEVEERLVGLLRYYGMLRSEPDGVSATVMSFSATAVRRTRDLAPDLPTVLLLGFLPPWLRDGRLPPGVRIAGPAVRLLRARPWLVERVHRHGNKVYVWTVNEPRELDLVLRLGADGIISDRPGYVLECLGRS